MIGTYLMASFFCILATAGLFLGAANHIAQSRWNKHPLSRVSQERAASFSTRY